MFHGGGEVEIRHDVWEVMFHLLLSASAGVIRSSREVYLEESFPFRLGDVVQSPLPFHFLHFAGHFVLVDVVGFVVNHHQVRHLCQVFQFVATQVLAVEGIQCITGTDARTERKNVFDDGWRCIGIFLFRLFFFITEEEVPVGQANETVARNLSSDAVFFAHYIVLNETKYFVTILGRNEKVLVAVEVIGERVALVAPRFQSSEVSIQQTVINYQARSHDEEVFGVSSAFLFFVAGVQYLPKQEGMHHPRLSCAGSHLHGILRDVVLFLAEGFHVGFRHQVGCGLFIDFAYGSNLQYFV